MIQLSRTRLQHKKTIDGVRVGVNTPYIINTAHQNVRTINVQKPFSAYIRFRSQNQTTNARISINARRGVSCLCAQTTNQTRERQLVQHAIPVA